MKDKHIARELLTVAKSLAAGTWSLPKQADVGKVLKMFQRMRSGEPPLPGKPRPGDAFYGLLGDDALFDDFDSAERNYYEACAEAVARRVKQLAAQKPSDFKDQQEYAALVELAKKMR